MQFCIKKKFCFTNIWEILDTKKNPCHTHEIKIEQNQSSLHNQTENTEMYSCLWVKCSSQAPSLDKLMTHICENHIGSGKVNKNRYTK